MPLIRRALSLWRNVMHRDRVERDLDDEVLGVFELLVDEKGCTGTRPEDARRAATLELGRMEAVKDARRTREIGIRIAMGAQRADVLGMVMRQGMSLVVIGSAIGLALAAASSRLFASLLFGVPPLDPLSFGGAATLFAAIGLAACYAPARRATRIDAVVALRSE